MEALKLQMMAVIKKTMKLIALICLSFCCCFCFVVVVVVVVMPADHDNGKVYV